MMMAMARVDFSSCPGFYAGAGFFTGTNFGIFAGPGGGFVPAAVMSSV